MYIKYLSRAAFTAEASVLASDMRAFLVRLSLFFPFPQHSNTQK